ncbi:hypothetical protein LPJ56_007041, partial [Coemansia sp. RSA 2599]
LCHLCPGSTDCFQETRDCERRWRLCLWRTRCGQQPQRQQRPADRLFADHRRQRRPKHICQ